MRELTDKFDRANEVKEGDFLIYLDLPKQERKVYLFDKPTSELPCLIEFAALVREYVVGGIKARLTMVKWESAINIKNIREVRLEDYSSYYR